MIYDTSSSFPAPPLQSISIPFFGLLCPNYRLHMALYNIYLVYSQRSELCEVAVSFGPIFHNL